MRGLKGWLALGLGSGLVLASSPAEAQIPVPPGLNFSCTADAANRQPLMNWITARLNVQRPGADPGQTWFRGTDHAGGGHRARLTLGSDESLRIGPVASVRPVHGANTLQALDRIDPPGGGASVQVAGVIVARVEIEPFRDPVTGDSGYAPLDLPPGTSYVMICAPSSGKADPDSALIIPADTARPIVKRAMRYYSIPDALPTSRARFRERNSQAMCASCKGDGWCELS